MSRRLFRTYPLTPFPPPERKIKEESKRGFASLHNKFPLPFNNRSLFNQECLRGALAPLHKIISPSLGKGGG